MEKNIKKVKKFQKTLICLVVMLLMILSFIVGKIKNANADDVSYDYLSSEISYDSTGNSLNATNVKDAIDELYSKVGKCPIGKFCYSSGEIRAISGGNILRAYTYDESTCVTGNESGCVITNCYVGGTCSVGTIIDYFVNNATVVRFHVLHDDGETMTMQTQQTQVKGVAWHAGSNDASNGPDTVLNQLESQTIGWNNVNDIEYRGDGTTFVGMNNNNNYCTSYSSCGSYDYTYPTRTVKARMIMLQEAVDVGCTTNNSSCPKFMYNYLRDAMNYGATENGDGGGNWGYWTMGSISSKAWYVSRNGYVRTNNISYSDYGARAVVVVNK